MGGRFGDSQHLFRMAGLYAVGTLALLVLRGIMVPADFGVYGHFRAGALADNAAEELRFAGREACETCHDDVSAARAGGAHDRVGCESCHGPLAIHAADPGSAEPALPDLEGLCLDCHAANASKPSQFPQVDEEEHAGGEACDGCHDPHSPGFE